MMSGRIILGSSFVLFLFLLSGLFASSGFSSSSTLNGGSIVTTYSSGFRASSGTVVDYVSASYVLPHYQCNLVCQTTLLLGIGVNPKLSPVKIQSSGAVQIGVDAVCTMKNCVYYPYIFLGTGAGLYYNYLPSCKMCGNIFMSIQFVNGQVLFYFVQSGSGFVIHKSFPLSVVGAEPLASAWWLLSCSSCPKAFQSGGSYTGFVQSDYAVFNGGKLLPLAQLPHLTKVIGGAVGVPNLYKSSSFNITL